MMKKISYTLLITLGLLIPAVVLPGAVSAVKVNVFQACNAATNNGVSAGGTDVCQEANKGGNPIIHTLTVVLDILSTVVGVAAVIMLIIGGFKFVTSGGDSAAVKSARETILYALIGAVVVAFSQAIIAFVLNKIK